MVHGCTVSGRLWNDNGFTSVHKMGLLILKINRIKNFFENFDLPVKFPNIKINEFIELMSMTRRLKII